MCYGRANKVGHPYCLNNNSYLCQHSHDHPHDLVICKAVSFIEVLFHVLYFTFARVMPSPWDGGPSPGVLTSRNHQVLNSKKDSGWLYLNHCLFSFPLKLQMRTWKPGTWAPGRASPPALMRRTMALRSSRPSSSPKDDPPSLWRAGPGSLS